VFDKAYLDLLASILRATHQSLPTQFLSRYFRYCSLAPHSSSSEQHHLWEEGARGSTATSDAWVEVWIEMMKCLARDGSSLAPTLIHIVETKVEDSINLMPISKKVSSINSVASEEADQIEFPSRPGQSDRHFKSFCFASSPRQRHSWIHHISCRLVQNLQDVPDLSQDLAPLDRDFTLCTPAALRSGVGCSQTEIRHICSTYLEQDCLSDVY
jgi:hypothetical protein